MGAQLGRSLGMSDDTRLSKLLIRNLPIIETNFDRLEETIYYYLNNLRAKGSNPILIYSRVHIHGIKKSKYYIPEWKIDSHELKNIDRFSGTFDGAPIIDFRGLVDQDILLIDFSHFAKLVQYRVDKEGEYPLSITIAPIDEKAADKLIMDQPNLLIDKDSGDKIEKENAIRDLLQRVHLQIWESCRLEDLNLNYGVRIQLKN